MNRIGALRMRTAVMCTLWNQRGERMNFRGTRMKSARRLNGGR